MNSQPTVYAWTIEVLPTLVDGLSDALFQEGALAVTIEPLEDEDGDQVYAEPGFESDRHWRNNRLQVLVAQSDASSPTAAAAFLRSALLRLSVDGLEATTWQQLQATIVASQSPPQRVEDDVDWVKKSQAQFDLLEIGQRLCIVPSWRREALASQAESVASRHLLYLDPGMAFGSGSHPSTQLCLRWLESQSLGGKRVLDYGCGSGILALFANKLGGEVWASDIDPLALDATAENADRNACQVKVLHLEECVGLQFDVVLANILATVLITIAPQLAGLLLPGATLVLAGVLHGQAEAVRAAYAPYLSLQIEGRDDDWVLLSGCKQ